MAQAYEYLTVTDSGATSFVATLATNDAAGWEVIGFAYDNLVYSALLRRRV